MTDLIKQPNPYPGPHPFQRGQMLYGRDQELRDLKDLLIAERIVLFYSPSGAGKTSLIQAALIPALEAAKPTFRVFPPIRVGLERPPEASRANRYLLSLLQSLEKDLPADRQMKPREWVEPNLEWYLERLSKIGDDSEYVVLVFDQFEEILTVDPTDVATKEAFFREIGQALRNRQRWALFAMREEFIAGLDPYLRFIPTRLAATYRLDLLGETAALDAIRVPARAAGVEFSADAGRMLVDNLRTVQIQQPDGSTVPSLGPYVEPVQLQVVCRRLWEGPAPDDGRIDTADVGSVGNVDDALRGYYADTLASVASATGMPERALRDWVERQLISKGDIRGQALMGEGASQGLDNQAIWPLVDAHLVRAERRRGATWFELAHDRLIAPIMTDNEAWRQEHLSTLQRQAALWAREGRPTGLLLQGQTLVVAETWAVAHINELLDHERDFLEASREARAVAERERRQAQRIRRLAVGASIATILALFALLAALLNYRNAKHEAQLSLSRQLAAQSANHLEARQELALLLALTANDVAATVEARGSLLVALEHNPQMVAWARAPDGPVTAFALSGNGRRLATGGGRAIQSATSPVQGPAIERWEGAITIWDVDETGVWPRLNLPPLAERTTALAFSPDGATLASGDEGGAIVLWDTAASPPAARPLGHHADRVNGLAFGPKGQRLASLGKSEIVLWDLSAPPEAARTSLQSGERVRSLAFDPKGRTLAVGYEDGRIILWDINSRQTSELAGSQGTDSLGLTPTAQANSLDFDRDGQRLAAGRNDGVVVLWDLNGREPTILPGSVGAVECLSFSPDGGVLAAGGRDKTIRLWDMEKLKEVGPPLKGQDGWVTGIAFGPDGNTLTAGGDDGKVIRWDIAATSRLGRALAGIHDDEIWTVAVSPDGRRLASGGKDGRVVLWDLESGRPFEVSRGTDPVRTVTFNPDGNALAAGGQDGHITLWDITSSKPVKKVELVHSEGQFVTDLVFSPDGRLLASGSFEGDVKVWDLRAAPPTATALHHPKGQVWSVAFSPDGKTLASSDDVGRIRLWNVATGREWGEPLTMDGIIMTVAFSPDRRLLAAGNSEKQIVIWDITSGSEVGRLVGHTDAVTGVAFSPDGKSLASSSYDGTMLLWDVAERRMIGEPLRGHDLPVNGLAFGSDGRFVVTASDDRALRAWNLDLNSWRQEACRLANRNLTGEEWQQYLGKDRDPATCPKTDAGLKR